MLSSGKHAVEGRVFSCTDVCVACSCCGRHPHPCSLGGGCLCAAVGVVKCVDQVMLSLSLCVVVCSVTVLGVVGRCSSIRNEVND